MSRKEFDEIQHALRRLEVLKQKILKSERFPRDNERNFNGIYNFDDFRVHVSNHEEECKVRDNDTDILLFYFDKNIFFDIMKEKKELYISKFFGEIEWVGNLKI